MLNECCAFTFKNQLDRPRLARTYSLLLLIASIINLVVYIQWLRVSFLCSVDHCSPDSLYTQSSSLPPLPLFRRLTLTRTDHACGAPVRRGNCIVKRVTTATATNHRANSTTSRQQPTRAEGGPGISRPSCCHHLVGCYQHHQSAILHRCGANCLGG